MLEVRQLHLPHSVLEVMQLLKHKPVRDSSPMVEVLPLVKLLSNYTSTLMLVCQALHSEEAKLDRYFELQSTVAVKPFISDILNVSSTEINQSICVFVIGM
ncbi:hypothetical protein KC19_3G255200 [Ceratodon purpureus]|uniref:Uncharacterized protein n=1 Tax=Ceratodon purpureus TaxID=3225 RepID=A0A8T0IR21_CERPU|nr:hypothetical protein KC19_3G255200 [Ceratodon purpureus]